MSGEHTLTINEDGEIIDPPASAYDQAVAEAEAAGVELPADPPSSSTDVVVSTRREAIQPTSLTMLELTDLGKAFAASGFFKDAASISQAMVKIMAGQEIGIGPFQSCAGFHLIEGKLTMSAGLVGALVKRSGRYNYLVLQATDQICELEWTDHGEIVGRSSFSEADRERAGLSLVGRKGGKSGWAKYPADMMFARALTQGARRYCPDIFGGSVYGEGEIE